MSRYGSGKGSQPTFWLVAAGIACGALAFGCASEATDNAIAPELGGPDGGMAGEGAAGTNGGAGTGGTGASGSGGTGGDEGPFVPTGEPLSAPDMTWTFVDFPDTQCRDGSPAGIGLSLNGASDKLMIYLEGGGACFDFLTCLGNPANVANSRGAKTGGVFARNNPENPVADWNFVYVPYCTGDVHLGTRENGTVEGVSGPQQFVGRLNLRKFLHRIVPTFPNLTQVLLTGVSAGGFGAAANTEFVQWAFGDVPVTGIDDSGPPMSATYLPECLQEKWRTTWGFEGSLLKDCGTDCPNPNDYSIDYTLHVARKFPDRMGGLIETTADGTISAFYGYGQTANGMPCGGSLITPVPPEQFRAGLLEYRQIVQDAGANLGTWFMEGNQHTFLGGGSFYTATATPGGVRLLDWFTDILDGTAAAHVGP